MAAVSCSAPALAPRLDVATARAVRARIASAPLTARGGVAAHAVAHVPATSETRPSSLPARFGVVRRASPPRRARSRRASGDARDGLALSGRRSASVAVPPPSPPAGLVAGFVRGDYGGLCVRMPTTSPSSSALR